MLSIFTVETVEPRQTSTTSTLVQHPDDGVSVADAMMQAVWDYLQTPDGQRALTYAGGEFNWGDSFGHMDAEDWAKRGILLLDTPESTVNHDQDIYNVAPFPIQEKIDALLDEGDDSQAENRISINSDTTSQNIDESETNS